MVRRANDRVREPPRLDASLTCYIRVTPRCIASYRAGSLFVLSFLSLCRLLLRSPDADMRLWRYRQRYRVVCIVSCLTAIAALRRAHCARHLDGDLKTWMSGISPLGIVPNTLAPPTPITLFFSVLTLCLLNTPPHPPHTTRNGSR